MAQSVKHATVNIRALIKLKMSNIAFPTNPKWIPMGEQLLRNKRHFSVSSKRLNPVETKELLIPVPHGNIAAKVWGRETGYPVLAVHGWLDNCGTFDRLIPLLSEDLNIVAIDVAGHGMSTHKPPGFIYRDLDLIIDFKRVADFLGWQKFHMIGHSMGGALSLAYASLFPESVNKLVVLDIVKPSSRPLHFFPKETIKSIFHHLEIEKKLSSPPPIYTLETAAARLKKGMFDEITMESAKILIKRGTQYSECGNGYIFSRDLRCRTVEELSRVSHETLKQFMSNVQSELLMIMANNTHTNYKTHTPDVVDEFIEIYRKNCKSFNLKTVEGNHFVHLNNPERVAPFINEFLSNAL